jgi:DNA-binding NtrC family response regulator
MIEMERTVGQSNGALSIETANEDRFHREGSLKVGLGLVKELTLALLCELKSLETSEPPMLSDRIDFNGEVRRFEIELIRCALIRTGGHQTRAAQLLGIKLTTLHDKIKRYKIDPRKLTEGV